MKRLEDGLFTNVVDESTAVIKTSEIRAKKTTYRNRLRKTKQRVQTQTIQKKVILEPRTILKMKISL